MIIKGKFDVDVPVKKVWDVMLDVETMASCIPGVEGDTIKIDESTFDNIIFQKISFLRVKFKTRTVIKEKEPLERLTFITDGKDTMTGTVLNVKSTVFLTEISGMKTEISYEADMRLVGRLATFGEGLMRKKSKEIGEIVVQNMEEKIVSG